MFYGSDDKLLIRNDGYAGWRAQYDDRGNQIDIIWVDDKLQPTINKNADIGVARISKKFDQRGNVSEEKKFGPSGALMDGPEGWAHKVSDYDMATGALIKETRYTSDGRLLPEKRELEAKN
jgi:hypothetical protein